MSAFQKLFLATAILGTGLAVAILLGQPVVIRKPTVSSPQPPPQTVALTPPVASRTASSNVPSVRLLPDADAQLKTTSTLDAPALLAPLAATSSFSSDPIAAPPTQLNPATSLAAPRTFESSGPVVHLRNEAPRAIGNEPRSPITFRRLPPVEGQPILASTSSVPAQAASVWSTSPQPIPVEPIATANNNTPAMPAAFANPSPSNENQAAPPPAQFTADDTDDSHTHVVADGDSLEKIAALYLSDPQRGKEIYELNRDVLSDPNLLPIGAELKIPDRTSRTSWNRQSCRPGFQSDATIRQASNGDLVPVRSLPEVNVIPPHAQLTRPIAAD